MTPDPTPAASAPIETPPAVRVLAAAWRGRFHIALATAACVAAAAVVAFVLPRTYRSTAALLLFPSPVKNQGSTVAALMARGLGVADYEILLTSDDLLMRAAASVKQSGAWPEAALEDLDSLDYLRRTMTVETEITEKTAYGSELSPVILLHADAPAPEQARALAAAWAEAAETLSADLAREGKAGSKDFLQEKFALADTSLTSVNSELRDLEISYNDELEEARLMHVHNRVVSYEEKLIDIGMQKESIQAEIELLKTKLAAEPERLVLWNSPPMEAVFMEEALGKRREPSKDGKTRGYESEVINSLWEHLRDKLSGKEIDLNGVLETERILTEELARQQAELDTQRALVAKKSFERNQIGQKVTALKTSYDQLAEKLEQAKIADAEEQILADVKVIAKPIAPDKPRGIGRAITLAAAALFGFLLSLGAVIARDELRRLLDQATPAA